MERVKPCFYIFLLIAVTSCTNTVSVDHLVDETKPFTVTIPESEQSETRILPLTHRHRQFLRWCENNRSGWQVSPASFGGKVYVTQDNFRFIYNPPTLVVIGFVDKEGDGHQYTKRVKRGELDFLLEE